MNIERMQPYGNINRKNRIDDQNENTKKKKRIVYRVDANIICELIRRGEKKSFIELLHLASIDQQGKTSVEHSETISDFISIAIHWNRSQCTTKDIEDLISIINPSISLNKLFNDVTINDIQYKQVNLIGLICFYGTTIEVFFAYDYFTSKWLFCFDGNLTMINDWNGVQRKSIDYHLQPFLLIYTYSSEKSLNITPLLHRTLLQTTVIRTSTDDTKQVMTNYEQSLLLKKSSLSRDFYSFDNLSSFSSLNSSMLFLPRSSLPSTDYINEQIVAKVMQQQLLKKESLVETSSLHQLRIQHDRKQMMISNETLSSGDSSTSSQQDSGLNSTIHDGLSDDSSRDSLMEIDSLQINQFDHDHNFILTSIEYDLEQSLKYENSSNYSSALESCQRALILLEQIHQSNINLSNYARTRKTNLLLRICSLKKRQIQHEQQLNSNTKKTSILSSTTRLKYPKKSVKFSDNIALILPPSNETSSKHLIHSYLKQQQSTSDYDSDTASSSTDLLIGLKECSLCYKRFSPTNQIDIYCLNCQFYMQRFRPLTNI